MEFKEFQKSRTVNYEDWASNYISYIPENIEKYYPKTEFTRHILWCSSFSLSVHPGFYSIKEWDTIQKEKQELERQRQERLAYEQSWKYKYYDMPTLCLGSFVGRVKTAWSVLRGKDYYDSRDED